MPVRVLEQLCRLGFASSPGPNDSVDNLSVKRRCTLGAGNGVPAHDFWCITNIEYRVAGVDAFWREGEVKVDSGDQAAFLEQWPDYLVRRTRVRRRFQNHQHPSSQVPGERNHCGANGSEVRTAILGQWGRNAYDDCLRLSQLLLVGCCPKPQ